MKISIGTNIQEGPWGGGNLFAINFKNYLEKRGHKVVFDLKDIDIDIILLTEPRRTSPSSAFTNYDVEDYILYKNPDALVVHRVNECDEHKDTNFINKYIAYANKCADATIFVSSWIRDLYLSYDHIREKPYEVVLAGSNNKIFNSDNLKQWDKKTKFKLVTHHWSNNWNKGFDIYKKIDEMLNDETFKEKIEFNFIGRLPDNLFLKNTNVIPPMHGVDLAKELQKNNFYITGTINEPSGNHHIEAAQCGLPILYIDSGGVKEYCEGYGIEYNIDNLKTKINESIEEYDEYFEKVKKYDKNSDFMCNDFLNFFEKILKDKSYLQKNRKLQRKSLLKLAYLKLNRFNFIKNR